MVSRSKHHVVLRVEWLNFPALPREPRAVRRIAIGLNSQMRIATKDELAFRKDCSLRAEVADELHIVTHYDNGLPLVKKRENTPWHFS